MTTYTPAQLEAWAGLGPWVIVVDAHFPYNGHVRDQSKDEHVCGVFGEVEAIDEFDSTIVPDDNAALIAAAPDLARLVLEKGAEIARLKAALKTIANANGSERPDASWDASTLLRELRKLARQAMKETSDE